MNPDDVGDESEASYLYEQWLVEQFYPEPENGMEDDDVIPF